MSTSIGPTAFQVMLKPCGPICNLRCVYCYYLDKARLYQDSTFRMSEEVLETFTRQYIAAQRVPEVIFAWQGGEPLLMGLDFFERAVKVQSRYRRPGVRILNALQTNATLLDERWCRFLRQHEFLVGVSLDGPAELHDVYRRDAVGGPTFKQVMAGIALLQRHAIEYNILAAVHAANADHPLEVYRFLRDAVGATFIQFIPIVEPAGADVSTRSVNGRAYGEFLCAIFDEWVRRDVGRLFVQLFDAALAAWVSGRSGLCVHEPTCGTALALEHNGDLYACDHFVTAKHRLGNILATPLAELVGSVRRARFGRDKRDTLPAPCIECDVRFVCNGGCPKDRLTNGLNHLCEGYRSFFRHIDQPMRLMAELWRAGRPPAEVMLTLAPKGFPEQGRNIRNLTGS